MEKESGEFNSLVYLFESIGYLISIDGIDSKKQVEFLFMIQTPLLSRIQSIIDYGETNRINIVLVYELSDLITAVGSISKGFPEYNQQTNSSVPPWSECWKTTMQGILIVLVRYNQYPSIREAVRFALQRMAGCMGPEFLGFLPTFFQSGLLSTDSASELTEFLPFVCLIVHKFPAQIVSPMLAELWLPLRNKLNVFLKQAPVGTDDTINLTALRKADLNLLGTLFLSDLDGILTLPQNLSHLPNLLDHIISCLDGLSDLATKKLVFSVLTKMIYCWSSSTAPITPPQEKSHENKPPLPKHPLQGFDAFVYDRIIPLTFSPLSPDFELSESPTNSILIEIAILHQTALNSLGQNYINFISQTYLPSLSCPPTTISEFVTAISKDKRDFRAYLSVN